MMHEMTVMRICTVRVRYRIVIDNIISESRRTTIGVQLLSTAHVANLPYDTPSVVADAVCGADYTCT